MVLLVVLYIVFNQLLKQKRKFCFAIVSTCLFIFVSVLPRNVIGLAAIGTSVRRSRRSAFGRLTGNDVSGHYKRHYFLFLFFFFFFFFSPSSTFLIEGVLGSKNLFSKS